MIQSIYQGEDRINDINQFDKFFFKVSSFFGVMSVLIYTFMTFYLVIKESLEGVSVTKLLIYLLLLIICSLIIIVKSFNLLHIVKKRTSDYITGFFFIFLPPITLYFITGIYTFLAVYLQLS